MIRSSIEKMLSLHDSGHDISQLSLVFKIRPEKVIKILKDNGRKYKANEPPEPSPAKKARIRRAVEYHQKLIYSSDEGLI